MHELFTKYILFPIHKFIYTSRLFIDSLSSKQSHELKKHCLSSTLASYILLILFWGLVCQDYSNTSKMTILEANFVNYMIDFLLDNPVQKLCFGIYLIVFPVQFTIYTSQLFRNTLLKEALKDQEYKLAASFINDGAKYPFDPMNYIFYRFEDGDIETHEEEVEQNSDMIAFNLPKLPHKDAKEASDLNASFASLVEVMISSVQSTYLEMIMNQSIQMDFHNNVAPILTPTHVLYIVNFYGEFNSNKYRDQLDKTLKKIVDSHGPIISNLFNLNSLESNDYAKVMLKNNVIKKLCYWMIFLSTRSIQPSSQILFEVFSKHKVESELLKLYLITYMVCVMYRTEMFNLKQAFASSMRSVMQPFYLNDKYKNTQCFESLFFMHYQDCQDNNGRITYEKAKFKDICLFYMTLSVIDDVHQTQLTHYSTTRFSDLYIKYLLLNIFNRYDINLSNKEDLKVNIQKFKLFRWECINDELSNFLLDPKNSEKLLEYLMDNPAKPIYKLLKLSLIQKHILMNKVLIYKKEHPNDDLSHVINAIEYSDTRIITLNDAFKMLMSEEVNAESFYLVYQQWLILSLLFPKELLLLENKNIPDELAVLVQDYDPNYPEDFIDLSIVLGGELYKLKEASGSVCYSKKLNFYKYLSSNNSVRHPFLDKTLSHDDIELYPINNFKEFSSALIYGFKMYHLQQLYKEHPHSPYVLKLLETFDEKSKQTESYQKFVKSMDICSTKNVSMFHDNSQSIGCLPSTSIDPHIA